jgi:hypothetical protein
LLLLWSSLASTLASSPSLLLDPLREMRERLCEMTDLTRFTYLINQCLRFLWTRDQQEEIQRLANEVLKENEQLREENERLAKIVRVYAAHNPQWMFEGRLQDPNGAHAALAAHDARKEPTP